MQTITLTDHKRRRKFDLSGPANFDDLSFGQLAGIIRIRKKYRNEDLQAMDIAQLLFAIPDDENSRLTTLQKLQLATAVEFVFEMDNIDTPVKMERWLFPALPGTGLIGPADGLENLTFQELMFADRRLDDYRNTRDEKYLDELVAVLMRPRSLMSRFKSSDDHRQLFNETAIRKRAVKIARYINEDTRQAIRFNYVACRSQMAGYFKNLFPAADDEVKGNKPSANESWLDVAINLARREPGALGTLHNIEKDNVYLVLKVLDQVIKEHKEREAELNK